MITIKEIAKLTGYSPSTVSIVLRGLADERHISDTAAAKIQACASENGYMANVQAVKLRANNASSRYQFAIFWSPDYRARVMYRFIRTIEDKIRTENLPCDVSLHPFDPEHLREYLTPEVLSSHHGFLICNTSEKDLSWIEAKKISRPLVLYNRYSSVYPSVSMDDKTIGRLPADVFYRNGCHYPAYITTPATFNGMILRNNLFSYECTEHGMRLPTKMICENSPISAYKATERLMKEHPETDCVFYSSDYYALGGLRFFQENHIKIPEKIKIIAVGNDDSSLGEVAFPSLTAIYLPIEKVASECFSLLMKQIHYKNVPASTTIYPVYTVYRESCPEGS